MSSRESVTSWFHELQSGQSSAAQRLWERYYDQLVGLARARLEGTARRMADEEDVALSAFKSFCVGARQGRYPEIADRDSLWRLLVVIAARKAADLANYQSRKKRDAARLEQDAGDEDALIDRIAGQAPTPEFAALVAEAFQARIESLEDDFLQQVALLKLDGYTNEEIAEQTACSVSTVERRVRLIRRIWQNTNPQET